MRHELSCTPNAPVAASGDTRRGPVEIDPALLQYVGGGLPKGGWGIAPDALPKGGWGAEANALPKGGWGA